MGNLKTNRARHLRVGHVRAGFIDETNNTWSCLRMVHPGEDSLYCVF